MFAGDDYNTAAVVWNSPAYHTASAKWTSTVSNRLLLEAGYSNNTEDYTNESLPGVSKPRGSAAWYAGAARRDLDLVSTSVQPLISNINTTSPLRYNVQGSTVVRHRLAQHEVRCAADLGATSATPTTATPTSISSIAATATGIPFTVPNTVAVYNTPIVSREELVYDFGHLRPGSVDLQAPDDQRRVALRMGQRPRAGADLAGGSLRSRAQLTRKRRTFRTRVTRRRASAWPTTCSATARPR